MGDFVEDWKRQREEVEDGIDQLPEDLRKQIRWVNLEGLFQELEAEFGDGDVSAALQCVHVCVADGIPPQAWPAWARKYFVYACQEGYEGKLKSWDDVFGHPYSEDKYRREIRDAHFPQVIYERVEAARKAGRPIDDKLFEEVGLALGIGGKTLTKRLYDRARDQLAEVEFAVGQDAAEMERNAKIDKARMEVVWRSVEALSAQGQPLDKIFGELAFLLSTDVEDVTSLYRRALKVRAASTPTPQKPTE